MAVAIDIYVHVLYNFNMFHFVHIQLHELREVCMLIEDWVKMRTELIYVEYVYM